MSSTNTDALYFMTRCRATMGNARIARWECGDTATRTRCGVATHDTLLLRRRTAGTRNTPFTTPLAGSAPDLTTPFDTAGDAAIDDAAEDKGEVGGV